MDIEDKMLEDAIFDNFQPILTALEEKEKQGDEDEREVHESQSRV